MVQKIKSWWENNWVLGIVISVASALIIGLGSGFVIASQKIAAQEVINENTKSEVKSLKEVSTKFVTKDDFNKAVDRIIENENNGFTNINSRLDSHLQQTNIYSNSRLVAK